MVKTLNADCVGGPRKPYTCAGCPALAQNRYPLIKVQFYPSGSVLRDNQILGTGRVSIPVIFACESKVFVGCTSIC